MECGERGGEEGVARACTVVRKGEQVLRRTNEGGWDEVKWNRPCMLGLGWAKGGNSVLLKVTLVLWAIGARIGWLGKRETGEMLVYPVVLGVYILIKRENIKCNFRFNCSTTILCSRSHWKGILVVYNSQHLWFCHELLNMFTFSSLFFAISRPRRLTFFMSKDFPYETVRACI